LKTETEILGLPPRDLQRKKLQEQGFKQPAIDQVVEGRKKRAKGMQKSNEN